MTINGQDFIVIREPTSDKSASATVDGCVIRIKVPVSVSREEGFRIFLELRRRIIARIQKGPRSYKRSRKLVFRDGQQITVFGKHFVLKKEQANGEVVSSAHLCNGCVRVKICKSLTQENEEETFSNLVRRVIARDLKPQIEKKVRQLNELHVRGRVSRVFIRDNLTNWGSCSSRGNIGLSFRLLFAPVEVMDYVIIHELTHMIESNHSSEFWDLVKKTIPDYQKHREWLKINGHALGPTTESTEAEILEVVK